MGPLQKRLILTDWGKKVRPGTSGKIKVGLTGEPKKVTLSKNKTFAVTPLVLTPFVPFRRPRKKRSHLPVGGGGDDSQYARHGLLVPRAQAEHQEGHHSQPVF